MVDVENLAGVLWRLDELITHPMIYGELIENLPAAELRDLMKGLEESLTYVDHLLRQTSSVKPAEPSSAQSCRSVIKLRCPQHQLVLSQRSRRILRAGGTCWFAWGEEFSSMCYRNAGSPRRHGRHRDAPLLMATSLRAHAPNRPQSQTLKLYFSS